MQGGSHSPTLSGRASSLARLERRWRHAGRLICLTHPAKYEHFFGPCTLTQPCLLDLWNT